MNIDKKDIGEEPNKLDIEEKASYDEMDPVKDNEADVENQKNIMSRLRGNKNLIGIAACAAIIVIVLMISLFAHGDSNKVRQEEKMDYESENTVTPETYAEVGDNDTSEITTDAKAGKKWTNLTDETYSVSIQIMDGGYSGAFVEDGSDEKVKNILAVVMTNNGKMDIQYAEYVFHDGKDVVSFKVTNLPAGQSCVALESSRHPFHKKDVLELISRVVAQTEELPFARTELLVVDNSDNTITIMNLTESEIPVARVYYKNYDHDQDRFFGGVTYSASSEKIPAGEGVTLEPAHYSSDDSVIMGSTVLETAS